jgi:hypothetical protein
MDMNEAYIKTVNAITGWAQSKKLEEAFFNTDFKSIDEEKIPLDDPVYGDIELSVPPRDGDFVEVLVEKLNDLSDVNPDGLNGYWTFDDDIHIVIIFAEDEDKAVEKFKKRISSYSK